MAPDAPGAVIYPLLPTSRSNTLARTILLPARVR